MPKPKKEQITIRVLPETIAAINELATQKRMTKGDALDLLVVRGVAKSQRVTVGNRRDPSKKEPRS
jgi:hypothetical protein